MAARGPAGQRSWRKSLSRHGRIARNANRAVMPCGGNASHSPSLWPSADVPGPQPAPAAEQIGIVLIHGKQSAPAEHAELAAALANAGFATDVPEMCWTARRIYDRAYEACLQRNRCRNRPPEAEGRDRIRGGGTQPWRQRRLGYGAVTAGAQGRHRARARPSAGGLEQTAEVAASLATRPQARRRRPWRCPVPLHGLAMATSPSRSPRHRMRI